MGQPEFPIKASDDQVNLPLAFQRKIGVGSEQLSDRASSLYNALRSAIPIQRHYYVPATGYSYLDLYLMGMISPAQVPDFFILQNLVPTGKDGNGHPIFKAERTKVTIQDVIAAEGPRVPDADHSQRNFNTGIVLVVEHGHAPSHDLVERADAIAQRWVDYWDWTTGHRATMTTRPH